MFGHMPIIVELGWDIMFGHTPMIVELGCDIMFGHNSMIVVVVVCLPRPMEGMGRLQFSDLFS